MQPFILHNTIAGVLFAITVVVSYLFDGALTRRWRAQGENPPEWSFFFVVVVVTVCQVGRCSCNPSCRTDPGSPLVACGCGDNSYLGRDGLQSVGRLHLRPLLQANGRHSRGPSRHRSRALPLAETSGLLGDHCRLDRLRLGMGRLEQRGDHVCRFLRRLRDPHPDRGARSTRWLGRGICCLRESDRKAHSGRILAVRGGRTRSIGPSREWSREDVGLP